MGHPNLLIMTLSDDQATERRQRDAPLPGAYKVWLAGALASLLGDAVLYFGLGWAAATHGGVVAGLVLTAINLPRTVLLLLGGALADRLGPRRIMIYGDVAMIALTVFLALMAWSLGTPAWLLVTAGLLVGVVDAFYLPASGSMPRRLAGTAPLPRALALRQTGGQVVAMVGGSLGGFLVATAGLPGAALFDTATFTLMLCVLLILRPLARDDSATAGGGLLREVTDGLRLTWRDPVLRPALTLLAGAAACLLPATSLLIPLLAHHTGWSAGATGLIVGANGLGIMGAAGYVALRGAADRPGLAGVVGLFIASFGIAALALSASPLAAGISAVATGLGTGVFTTHIAPLVLSTAPSTHLSRVQSLLVLSQACALLAANPLLGTLADLANPPAALLACAALALVTALAGLVSAPLRAAGRSRKPPTAVRVRS